MFNAFAWCYRFLSRRADASHLHRPNRTTFSPASLSSPAFSNFSASDRCLDSQPLREWRRESRQISSLPCRVALFR